MDSLSFAAVSSSFSGRVLFLAIAAITYAAGLIAYRLLLHPLAGVPGPKIAAATSWWEVYENVWKPGRLPWDLTELHKTYGPIVRISPNGVHIADPEVYEKIYKVGSTFGKHEWYYQIAFGPQTFFTVGDNAKAKIERDPISGFFSRRSVVNNMQKMVLEEVELFSQRLSQYAASGKPMPIFRAFRSFTGDVITRIAWGMDEKLIMKDDFARQLFDDMTTVQQGMWKRLYFPRVTAVLQLTPPEYAAKLDSALAAFLNLIEICRNQVRRITEETKQTGYVGGVENVPTVFHALLDSETVIKGKKDEDIETMTGVGALIYVAGVETSANAMTHTTFRILENPAILKRLQQELVSAYPDPREEMSLLKLESLPYLTACINEGLRVSFGVLSRLPRTVPVTGFQYQNHYIPPGTQIGMSSFNMHTDPKIWPEPFSFTPERWLGKGNQLDKYLVPFSKGSRQCLGINLAMCEIYLTIGMLFRKYDLKVFETTAKDMEIIHCYFMAFTDNKAPKLQVMVKERT